MEHFDLWNSGVKEDFVYFSSVEKLFKYIEDHKIRFSTFLIKDSYTPGDSLECLLDEIALRDNCHVTYTDSTHPVALSTTSGYISIVSKAFFEANKAYFINYAKKKLAASIANKDSCISIPDYIFNSEVLNSIIANDGLRNTSFRLVEISSEKSLSEEDISLLKSLHLDFTIKHKDSTIEQISTNELIGGYTESFLKTTDNLHLSLPLSQEEIDNFKYINKDCKITIIAPKGKKDERAFYKSIEHILKSLKSHNNSYHITFDVNNREIFRQANILNNIPDNVNLVIQNDLYNYDVESYQKEEAKLEKLAAPIRDSNLSPLEKYLAVYNIVKQFKEYKENSTDTSKARYLRYIINDDNEYIVCVGFAKLLEDLMNRVGIPNMDLSVKVDTSYDKGFTQEEKILHHSGHARNLIKLDDDKYGIHGYYVVDSTWDNDLEQDRYLNALMTFNRKKEAKRLEALTDEDLLLDYNGVEDCKEKINYLFKKHLREILESKTPTTIMKKISKAKEECQKAINATTNRDEKLAAMKKMNEIINENTKEAYIRVYISIYLKMLDILAHTNYEKYCEFYDKYYSKINNYSLPLEELEPVINAATNDYAKYIIPLTNKEVSLDTIIDAAKVVKQTLGGYSDEEAQKWEAETKGKNEEIEKKAFPYKYDPNNPKEAYVETKEEIVSTSHTK